MSAITDSPSIHLIGKSEAIRGVEQDVASAARCDAKVLITGETGVGKEIVARLIHRRSGRSGRGLVTLNCGGLPDSLLETELFGHVRGSFTDAYRDKPGLLESVPGGTVFLDEVGEMSARMQSLLLRFLESGEIQRVGADRPQARADVRLIAATNRDLQAQMLTGAFRQDLYFRLNVIRIAVPPLRERTEDIPLFVEHFLHLSSGAHRLAAPEISPGALAALRDYHWPGNIRELKNVIERVVLRARGRTVALEDLPAELRSSGAPRTLARPAGAGDDERAGELVSLMVDRGESFWSAVHARFMARDLTRAELRAVIGMGLGATGGSYRLLLRRFNMPAHDYRRFLGFLRAHDCHLSFRTFRHPSSSRDQSRQEYRSA